METVMMTANQAGDQGRKQTKVVIVDDHPIVRQGLEQLISHEADLVVCGQAESANEAMQVIKATGPDVVIVDIVLKDSSGLDLIKDVKSQYPDTLVLAMSMYDELLYGERALRAGARGYIMKAAATELVITAIRKVRSGDIFVSERVAAKMMSKFVGGEPVAGASAIDALSDRELEVFTLIGQGFGTRQVAEQLYLSVKTIETHRAHIKEKLHLKDSSEMRRHAIQWYNSQQQG